VSAKQIERLEKTLARVTRGQGLDQASQGNSVILARDGEEAVRLFKENSEDIRLVVLDVAMPLLTGPEAYAQICALKPGFPVIFTTGYTSESASLKSHLEAGAIFLQKPYMPQELGRMVRGTLDRRTGSPS
jgi:DNA-binding response OmpR family regulator